MSNSFDFEDKFVFSQKKCDHFELINEALEFWKCCWLFRMEIILLCINIIILLFGLLSSSTESVGCINGS